MKKIEQEMLRAIRERRCWRKSNTHVIYSEIANVSQVYLHDNLIALCFHTTGLRLTSSAGWRTRTTKSRLNALGAGIYQRDFVWYNPDGIVFVDEPLVTILRNEIDARIAERKRMNDDNLFVA